MASRWNFDFDIDRRARQSSFSVSAAVPEYDSDDCDWKTDDEQDRNSPENQRRRARREACKADVVYWQTSCCASIVCVLPLLIVVICVLLAPPPTPTPPPPSICLQDCPVNENETLVSACSEQGNCSDPNTCVLLGSNGAAGCGSASCPAEPDNSSCACEDACGCVVQTALDELSFRQCTVVPIATPPPTTPAPATSPPCPDLACPTPIGYSETTPCSATGVCNATLCKLPNGHSCGTCLLLDEAEACTCNECTCEVSDGANSSMALPCTRDCCPEDPFAFGSSPYGSAEPTLCGDFDYNCDDDDDSGGEEYPCCYGVAEPIVNEHDTRSIYIVAECAVSNNNAALPDTDICGACEGGSTVDPGWACNSPVARKKRAMLPCPDACDGLVEVTSTTPPNVSECALFTDHCVPPNGGDGERCCLVIRR